MTANSSIRIEAIKHRVPSHWLPSLINYDYSGLEPEDFVQLRAFAQNEIGEMRKHNLHFIGFICAEDSYFTSFHGGRPYGCPPCDVTDCEFVFRID